MAYHLYGERTETGSEMGGSSVHSFPLFDNTCFHISYIIKTWICFSTIYPNNYYSL